MSRNRPARPTLVGMNYAQLELAEAELLDVIETGDFADDLRADNYGKALAAVRKAKVEADAKPHDRFAFVKARYFELLALEDALEGCVGAAGRSAGEKVELAIGRHRAKWVAGLDNRSEP